MQSRRQAGFIRNYSAKNIPVFQQEPSEFSYFRPRPPRDDNEEFSPYKIDEQPRQTQKQRPPLPQPRPQGKNREAEAQRDRKVQEELRAQGEEVLTRLREQAKSNEKRREERSKEKLQENLDNIRNKIEQVDFALRELKQSKHTEKDRLKAKLQQAQAESDSSSEESEEVVLNSIPSPKLSVERAAHHRDSAEHQQQQPVIRQSNERSNSYSQRENVVTFNSRTSNNPPLQIRDYSSSEEEEDQQEDQQYEKQKERERQEEEEEEDSNYLPEKVMHERELQERKPKQPPVRHIEQQSVVPQRQAKGVYQNRGGVCFDIDTKQFTEPIPQPRVQPRPSKKPKVDKRSEMLRRRETAKAYDKQARKALFTAYH